MPFILLLLNIQQIECQENKPICELKLVNRPNEPIAYKISAERLVLEDIRPNIIGEIEEIGEYERKMRNKPKRVPEGIFKKGNQIYFKKFDGFYFGEDQVGEELTKLKERNREIEEDRNKKGRKRKNKKTLPNYDQMGVDACTAKIIPARNIYFKENKNGKLVFKTEHYGNFFWRGIKTFFTQRTIYLTFEDGNGCELLTHNSQPHKPIALYNCPEGICQENTIFYFGWSQREMFILDGYDYGKIVEKCQGKLKEIEKFNDVHSVTIGTSQQISETNNFVDANDNDENGEIKMMSKERK